MSNIFGWLNLVSLEYTHIQSKKTFFNSLHRKCEVSLIIPSSCLLSVCHNALAICEIVFMWMGYLCRASSSSVVNGKTNDFHNWKDHVWTLKWHTRLEIEMVKSIIFWTQFIRETRINDAYIQKWSNMGQYLKLHFIINNKHHTYASLYTHRD